jgi:hypothetical protein
MSKAYWRRYRAHKAAGLTREQRRAAYRQCGQKRRYQTFREAHNRAQWQRKHRGRCLYCYYCSLCRGFHHAQKKGQADADRDDTPADTV